MSTMPMSPEMQERIARVYGPHSGQSTQLKDLFPSYPTAAGTSLPEMIQNDPQAYVRLLQAGQMDPFEVGDKVYGFRPRTLGSAGNTLVLDKGDRGKAALAAAAAQYANQRRMERLLAALEGREPNPGILGQGVGALGGLLGGERQGAPDPGAYQGWEGVGQGGPRTGSALPPAQDRSFGQTVGDWLLRAAGSGIL